MLAGLLLKTALFPLHFWLPPAHSSAPAPVSALLSALVVKGSFFVALRIWLDVLPAPLPDFVATALGAAGALAIVYGSICAILARRLKLLIAYSTVAQLGYLALLFPLAALLDDMRAVLVATVYFVIAHAVAKAAMFLAAGTLQHAAGHDELARLKPTARRLPIAMFAIALAGASLMGLPPSGGFIAKWSLLNVAIEGQAWSWVAAITAGGLLAAVYVFRVLALAFAGPGEPAQPAHEPRAALQWAPLALALVALGLGFTAAPIMESLGVGAASMGAAPAGGRP